MSGHAVNRDKRKKHVLDDERQPMEKALVYHGNITGTQAVWREQTSIHTECRVFACSLPGIGQFAVIIKYFVIYTHVQDTREYKYARLYHVFHTRHWDEKTKQNDTKTNCRPGIA